MTRLTRELIRKKAEHHDGIIGDLEEISLHQLELEKLEVIGELCRKLQILYLQNNIIPRIENIQYCKDLKYLNMALNNIQKIEGLQSCEFLEKLDLTVNFVDLDHFKDSIEHLIPLAHFKELFLMGNPCMEWPHAKDFIIATLPQLERLDGQDITRTERIKAKQGMQKMLEELEVKAKEAVAAKRAKELEELKREPDDDSSPWTPAARVELYREVQEQKEADEARRKEMEPRERDAEKEHREKTQAIRDEEERAKAALAAAGGSTGDSAPQAPAAAGSSEHSTTSGGKPTNLPRMANEGRVDFSLEDEDGKGNCVLRLPLPRFMDTSLVDLDVHPWYVSAVIKNKLFRIHWPEEVRADAGTAKRSTTSGELVITVPKLFPRAAYMSLVQREKAAEKAKRRAERSAAGEAEPVPGGLGDTLGGKSKKAVSGGKKGSTRKTAPASSAAAGGGSVMDMIMSAAASAKADKKKKKKASKAAGGSKAVSVAGIVPEAAAHNAAAAASMTEKSTRRTPVEPAADIASVDASSGAAKEQQVQSPVVDAAGGVLEMKQAPPARSSIEDID